MSEYDNTNRFSLFANTRKTKDSQPGYTGTINVEGVEYYLDAWVKDGKSGKFFSGSIKRKDAKPDTDRVAERQAPAADPFDDSSIPF